MRLLRIVVMLSFVALACNNEAYAKANVLSGIGKSIGKIFKPRPPRPPRPSGGSIRPPRLPRYETCPNCGGSGIILAPDSLMPCMRCGGKGHVSRS